MTELAKLSRQQWAERIQRKWTEAAEALIAVGAEMVAAYDELGFRDFYAMVQEDLGRSVRWAQMFLSIGRNEALAKHVSLLPADTLALYKLSRLPAEVVAESVDAGVITRKTGRKQAQRLVSDWLHTDTEERNVETFVTRWTPVSLGAFVPRGPLGQARLDMARDDVDHARSMASEWMLSDDLDDAIEASDPADRADFAEAVETFRDAATRLNLAAQSLLSIWPHPNR